MNLMEQIARHFFGEPNEARSRDGELRFGTHGSKSVDLKNNRWFDHENKEGGGPLDLIRRELGFTDSTDCYDWIEQQGYVNSYTRQRKEVAHYDYTDETGNLLFQVVRYEPKKFRQRKPNGRGRWIWKVKGSRQVPYRLPELLEGIGNQHVVFIPEGEKDVETLQRWNLVATCNAGGAGKFVDQLLQYFNNSDVVVLSDNDEVGRDHANQVAGKLKKVAQRVRLLDISKMWPECPAKGDISDWIAAGGTVERLNQIIDDLPDYTQAKFNYFDKDERRSAFTEGVSLDDFHAYMPQHSYIYIPTREHWPASSVNARLPHGVPVFDKDGNPLLDKDGEQERLKSGTWLDQNRAIEQMTWTPGQQMLIRDRLISEGGWIEKPGVTCFNLYRPPTIQLGDAAKAGPWLEHVHKVFSDEDAEWIILWCTQRVQHPEVKINHALVLGSEKQGTGKDTMLEPVKRAVGPWNFQEASPQQALGRFNGFLKSVVLRLNEARDLGDVNRYAFYEHTKVFTAAPPDVLLVDEKFLRAHNILNCVGVILTTNYKTNGIYLPAEDRRHYVAWTHITPGDFADGYWNKLWRWYNEGGDRHVAAYLRALDISSFDPKEPPPKTQAFWDIVDANRAPEDAELQDVLDKMGNPSAVTLLMVIRDAGSDNFTKWLGDPKNGRAIPHRFEQCGYTPVRKPGVKQGLWIVNGKRQVIYAQTDLSYRDQIVAAEELVQRSEVPSKQDRIPF